MLDDSEDFVDEKNRERCNKRRGSSTSTSNKKSASTLVVSGKWENATFVKKIATLLQEAKLDLSIEFSAGKSSQESPLKTVNSSVTGFSVYYQSLLCLWLFVLSVFTNFDLITHPRIYRQI